MCAGLWPEGPLRGAAPSCRPSGRALSLTGGDNGAYTPPSLSLRGQTMDRCSAPQPPFSISWGWQQWGTEEEQAPNSHTQFPKPFSAAQLGLHWGNVLLGIHSCPGAHELWMVPDQSVSTQSGTNQRSQWPVHSPLWVQIPGHGAVLGACGRERAEPRGNSAPHPPQMPVSVSLPGSDLTRVFKGRGGGNNKKHWPVCFEHLPRCSS